MGDFAGSCGGGLMSVAMPKEWHVLRGQETGKRRIDYQEKGESTGYLYAMCTGLPPYTPCETIHNDGILRRRSRGLVGNAHAKF